MYASIYQREKTGEIWHLSQWITCTKSLVEENAYAKLKNGHWSDYRILSFDTDNEWLEICDLLEDVNNDIPCAWAKLPII